MTKPTKTPINEGILQRVVRGVQYIAGGNTDWMPPGEPLAPIAAPNPVGRQFDYPVAVNIQQKPRAYEALSFADLRALADSYDILRLAIETRKDQMVKLQWSVKPKDSKQKMDQRCLELEKFFLLPDQEHDWDTWLRMLVEDQLVIDAATLYARKTYGGDLYALEPIDGATIKRLITPQGRTPLPPEPAYQQVLKGVTATNYTTDELLYFPRNQRTNKLYGYSPVEQVVMTVNIALRRQIHQLQYYTEGNVPEALVGVPDNWNPDQISAFQAYWDSLMEGNTAERRHMKFVPGGMNVAFTKDPLLKDEFDEWLARVICYAFSLSPAAFVKQMNRATADNAKEMALEEGLAPMMQWVKRLIDRVIVKYWGYTDLEFVWKDPKDIDTLQQAQIDQIYVGAKVLHPDEIRANLGYDPLTKEQKDDLNPPMPTFGLADDGTQAKVPDEGDDKKTPKEDDTDEDSEDDDDKKVKLAKKKAPCCATKLY